MTEVSNIAALLVDRYQLSPPVDIKGLVQEFADLEFCAWPQDCDGVAILSTLPHRVFVKDGQPRRRERFTLAHELGHVVIPWHVNAVDCKPVETQEFASEEVYLGMHNEAQANDFASRILIPDSFVEDLRRTYPDPTAVLEKLEQADVSAAAGVLALRRALLPGYVFISPDLEKPVRSEGTEFVNGRGRLRELSIRSGVSQHQGKSVSWFQMAQAVEPSLEINSRAAAKSILRELAQSSVGLRTGLTLQGIQQSVAGVLGAAKHVVTGLTPDVAMGVLKYRFSRKVELAPVIATPQFHDYLSFKARELTSGGAS